MWTLYIDKVLKNQATTVQTLKQNYRVHLDRPQTEK